MLILLPQTIIKTIVSGGIMCLAVLERKMYLSYNILIFVVYNAGVFCL